MNLGIEGRVAMVAAGTLGIGRAVVEELVAEGVRVSVCGRTERDVPRGSRFFSADVSKADDLDAWYAHTIKEFGSPTILVTNTGGPPAGNWTSMNDEQWQSGVDSTLMNVVRLVRLASPAMKEVGWGRIVHITSLVAKMPEPLLPISSTLRAGLMALTRLQATELAASGITVNGVLPGHTLTDRQRHLAQVLAEQNRSDEQTELERRAKSIPVQRLADPSEIAAAVAFLCSQRASFITGVNLVVDGGATRGLD
ncbi:MAG: SDR family oxidoreductase [Fimbriimonadaceae bacterium]|nr:SDR family oxidoreductase [Fimbriimonadaceae bacterium]